MKLALVKTQAYTMIAYVSHIHTDELNMKHKNCTASLLVDMTEWMMTRCTAPLLNSTDWRR